MDFKDTRAGTYMRVWQALLGNICSKAHYPIVLALIATQFFKIF